MLRHVAAFELRYQLRSPAFWVTTLLFFLLTFGAAASDQISLGGDGGNVHVNAPFVLAQSTLILQLFGLFVAAAFVANAVVRDDEARFGGLLHTTRLPVRDYLLGRFLGAWLTGMLAMASVPIGNAVGSAMPWLDPDTVGPFRADWYLYAWLVLSGPTLLISSAVLFGVALLTRSMAQTYVAVVVLIVGYLVAMGLLSQPRFESTVMLVDPFGIAALAIGTKYWTALELNSRMPPLEGPLLWNRVVWTSAALGLLALSVRLYRLEQRPWRLWRRAARPQPPPSTPAPMPAADTTLAPPSAVGSGRAALWALVRHDMAAAFRHPGYVVLVLVGCLNAGSALWFADEMYEAATLPVTRLMIQTLSGAFAIIPLLIAMYYAGELVWSSRERRLHEILDATPAPDWAFAVPKMLAITLVLASTLAGSALVAMGIQLVKGYTTLEISHYLLWYLVPWTIDVTQYAVLAVFVQALVPTKPMGWMVMMAYIISQSALQALGFEHPLFVYGASTPEPLSDMNGQGVYAAHAAWFRAFWSACALVLATLSTVLWRRGTVISLRERLPRLRTRLAGPSGVLVATGLAAMIGLGAWVVYNTNVLNTYRTAEAERDLQAAFERTLGPFETLPQPRITDVTLHVDLFPAEQRAAIRGHYVLVNRTAGPITDLHVQLPDDLDVTSLEVPGARLDHTWPEFAHRRFRFDTPLLPGGNTTVSFDLVRQQRGFRHRGNDTRLVDNGTFLNNSELTPAIGVDRSMYLQDRNERRKRGLPPESRPRPLEDDAARDAQVLRQDSDWVQADITVTTDADQQAIAPGYLVSEDVRDGRRMVRYRTDAPIQHFFSIQSARYAVARDRWRDVDLAVYYHPPHGSNVQTMLAAMKTSLELFSTSFSPFQFRQLRILEFPAYASFAQSFANTVPYSESIGFIQHRKSEDDIDGVTYVTAHEVAHQWWGHQIVSANQQGATFLIESLAQYSALRVMEQVYGPAQIRKFLKLEMDRYLRARGSERLEELPLVRVENQSYIHYQKGGIAMYLLKEELGAAVVDRALQRLLAAYAFKAAPYPNPSDFVRLLREEAGPAHDAIIRDQLERITVYDVSARLARTRQVEGGAWETTIDVEAAKRYADGLGQETPAMLDETFEVGLFTTEPGTRGFRSEHVLSFERRPLRDGAQQIVLRSAARPAFAGVDPYNKRIDRNTDDNVRAVEAAP